MRDTETQATIYPDLTDEEREQLGRYYLTAIDCPTCTGPRDFDDPADCPECFGSRIIHERTDR